MPGPAPAPISFPNEVSLMYGKHVYNIMNYRKANTHPDQEIELAHISRGLSCPPPNHCPVFPPKKVTKLTSNPTDQFCCINEVIVHIALQSLVSGFFQSWPLLSCVSED